MFAYPIATIDNHKPILSLAVHKTSMGFFSQRLRDIWVMKMLLFRGNSFLSADIFHFAQDPEWILLWFAHPLH